MGNRPSQDATWPNERLREEHSMTGLRAMRLISMRWRVAIGSERLKKAEKSFSQTLRERIIRQISFSPVMKRQHTQMIQSKKKRSLMSAGRA